MISSVQWIQRGKAARNPSKYAVDDAELQRVSKLANVHFDDAKKQLLDAQRAAAGMGDEEWEDDDEEDGDADKDMEAAEDKQPKEAKKEAAAKEDKDDLSRYRLDEYDDDEAGRGELAAFTNIKGLQFYRNNDEDPYITMKDDAEDEAEERAALEVLPTDNLLVTAKTEDEVSLLECYVYASSDSNLYVHHDLMLPSFPLCLEWLDYTPCNTDSADQNSERTGRTGNFIAVGTMDPEIEIWSMDTVEGLFPDAILGRKEATAALAGPKGTGKKKRRQQKERVANAEYHVDAVLSLSWNRVARNLLASASADHTVKLWDLSRPSTSESSSALRSFNVHSDKVQSVAWNTSGSAKGGNSQPSVLLTGSYDQTLRVFDSRDPAQALIARCQSDVESVRWNPWREYNFLASFESGIVQSFDARVLPSSAAAAAGATKSLFTLAAHDGPCTSIDISPHIPGCLLTSGGSDKLVKLWSIDEDPDVSPDAAQELSKPKSISMVCSRDLDAGKVFSASFCPDVPMTVAAAGSSGHLRIWDTLSNLGVRKTFGDRLRQMPKDVGEAPQIDGAEKGRGDGVVRLEDEGDDDDDDDDDAPALQSVGGAMETEGAEDEAMEE